MTPQQQRLQERFEQIQLQPWEDQKEEKGNLKDLTGGGLKTHEMAGESVNQVYLLKKELREHFS